VIADNRVVQGELAVIKISCPQELPEFTDALKLDNVAYG
jgi:hypothetical protein